MAITNAIIQSRRGNESDFDPDKMHPGEWAVSTDTRYVRMCFAPGVCVRMATYDAFEADMAKIRSILEEVQTIEEAIRRINTEVSANAEAVAEYTEQAKAYRDETKQYRDGAEASATNAKSSEDKAKVSETNAKVSETNAKISEQNAQRVAESLPEDYTELSKAFYNTAIKQKAVGDNIHVTDSAEARNVEFGLYGKAEQNGEPTPDNRKEITVSGSDGSVGVVSCGKNFLKYPYFYNSRTINGVAFTVNDDGSVTANGTATDNASFLCKSRSVGYYEFEEGSYILSGCPSGGSFNKYSLSMNKTVNGAQASVGHDYGNGLTFEVLEEETPHSVIVRVASGVTVSNLTFYPMIRRCDENGNPIGDDTYEPYKEPTIADIPTPNGLCGIKVSSGGNYVDENGQQWICDEIVKYADGSGNQIERVKYKTFDITSNWKISGTSNFIYLSDVMSECVVANSKQAKLMSNYSHAQSYDSMANGKVDYGVGISSAGSVLLRIKECTTLEDYLEYLSAKPLQVIAEITTEPIITDLSAEEIAEIEKLHTFYPVTNISNDAGCGMEVTYLADAKTYIDNQLAIQKAQQEESLLSLFRLLPEEIQATMIENDTNNLLTENGV